MIRKRRIVQLLTLNQQRYHYIAGALTQVDRQDALLMTRIFPPVRVTASLLHGFVFLRQCCIQSGCLHQLRNQLRSARGYKLDVQKELLSVWRSVSLGHRSKFSVRAEYFCIASRRFAFHSRGVRSTKIFFMYFLNLALDWGINVQSSCGAYLASYSVSTERLFPRQQNARCVKLTPIKSEVKIQWSYASIPLYAFIDMHRDKFFFSFLDADM